MGTWIMGWSSEETGSPDNRKYAALEIFRPDGRTPGEAPMRGALRVWKKTKNRTYCEEATVELSGLKALRDFIDREIKEAEA